MKWIIDWRAVYALTVTEIQFRNNPTKINKNIKFQFWFLSFRINKSLIWQSSDSIFEAKKKILFTLLVVIVSMKIKFSFNALLNRLLNCAVKIFFWMEFFLDSFRAAIKLFYLFSIYGYKADVMCVAFLTFHFFWFLLFLCNIRLMENKWNDLLQNQNKVSLIWAGIIPSNGKGVTANDCNKIIYNISCERNSYNRLWLDEISFGKCRALNFQLNCYKLLISYNK